MSEPKTSPSSNPAAGASRFDMFSKFYTQAYALATIPNDKKSTKEDDKKLHQRILITLDTITKLTFGLDGANKSKMVLHGAGVLELVIALTEKSNANAFSGEGSQKSVQIAALKAIKTCVLRNAAGRSRCRLAGIPEFVNHVLDTAILTSDAALAEEAFTALAATCLGDDLNALKASTEVKSTIRKAKEVFPKSDFESMHQKTLYLETLFEAIVKEQAKLLRKIKTANTSTENFFKNLVESEQNIRVGYTHFQDSKYALSVKHYNHAMKLLTPFINDTNLLDDYVLEIRSKRAPAELEVGDTKSCLEDTRILLEHKDAKAFGGRAGLLKIHGKALIKAGEVIDGKETFAKLKILCPEDDDEEIKKLLDGLKIDDNK